MITPTRILDCREMLCPGPLAQASRALREVAVNGTLEVLATDPAFIPDIQAFVSMTGHALVEAREDESGVRVVLRRTH